MTALLFSILLLPAAPALAADTLTIFVHSRVAGEPIDRPIEISLKVRCSKKKTVEFHKEKYCEFASLDKDLAQEKVTLHVLNYNPDNGLCEKPEAIELSFKGSCGN